jgi:rubrerythrin
METINELILDEAIKLERSVGKIYKMFQSNYAEDAEFWAEMANEEMCHAQVVADLKSFIDLNEETPNDFTSIGLSRLKTNNIQTQKIIDNFNKDQPRAWAFRTAIKLENSSSEDFYRDLVNTKKESKIIQIFQKLNDQDKKHYQRILDYIAEKDIDL